MYCLTLHQSGLYLIDHALGSPSDYDDVSEDFSQDAHLDLAISASAKVPEVTPYAAFSPKDMLALFTAEILRSFPLNLGFARVVGLVASACLPNPWLLP